MSGTPGNLARSLHDLKHQITRWKQKTFSVDSLTRTSSIPSGSYASGRRTVREFCLRTMTAPRPGIWGLGRRQRGFRSGISGPGCSATYPVTSENAGSFRNIKRSYKLLRVSGATEGQVVSRVLHQTGLFRHESIFGDIFQNPLLEKAYHDGKLRLSIR